MAWRIVQIPLLVYFHSFGFYVAADLRSTGRNIVVLIGFMLGGLRQARTSASERGGRYGRRDLLHFDLLLLIVSMSEVCLIRIYPVPLTEDVLLDAPRLWLRLGATARRRAPDLESSLSRRRCRRGFS